MTNDTAGSVNISSEETQALIGDLKLISQIEDPIERELALIKLAQGSDFSADDYRALLQIYANQEKTAWQRWKISRPIIYFERLFEEINYWLERWDFLKFLDYASRITIIVGLLTFISQLSNIQERAEIERRKSRYEAWQVVNSATNQRGGGGRSDALQTLKGDGVSLSGVSLEGAYLAGIDLSGADLTEANLKQADLTDADLSYADLAGADLQGADLNETNFYKANLRGANLEGAENIVNARFEGAFYDEETVGRVANSGAIGLQSLSGENLQGEKRLQGGPLESIDFSQANLMDVDLSSANLSLTNFSEANLTGANLAGANISSARFQGANLANANLDGVIIDSFFIYDNQTRFPEGNGLDIAQGINLDEFIVGEGGTLTWGMALHGGTRVPTTVAVIENIRELARQLEALQQQTGMKFTVTSWYRPPEINSRVGGATTSSHLQGQAADITIEGVGTCRDMVEKIAPLWAGRIGCPQITGLFVHLDIIEPFPLSDETRRWGVDGPETID